jgi:hypothetical protein
LSPLGKHHANIHRDLAMRLGARIGQLVDRFALRIKRLVFGPVVEGQTTDVVDEGFRRGTSARINEWSSSSTW